MFNKTGVSKFSFFKAPVTRTVKPHKDIDLTDVYMVVAGHFHKSITKQLRQITDPNANRNFKAENFNYVTFSGTFQKRGKNGLIKHSNLLVLDFDNISDIEKLKYQLLRDKYFETEFLFASPNGNGLKWVVSININEKYNHGDWFDAISRYIKTTYQIEVDSSGRDVLRVCFLSFDSDAFLHPRHGKICRLFPGDIYTVERKRFYPGRWLKEKKSTYKPAIETTDKNITKTQYHVEVIIRRIENFQIDLTCDYSDWVKLGFAFVSAFQEYGRGYFHRISRFYPRYDPAQCDEQFDRCLKNYKTGVTIKTFFAAAKDAGINIRV